MTDRPVDVTVIIPTFDRLWSLPAAVESCRGTACTTQIIVVDDGSRDGTWEWLQAQPDVVAIRQPNRGKDWAIATALPLARGEYLRFLDSDDAVLPGATDRQLAVARASHADLVVSGFEMVGEDGTLIERRDYEATDDFIAQQLGEGNGSHYSAFLFRREFVADVPHRQEFGALDDRMYILEVALAHPRIAVSPEPALRHTHHGHARLQATGGLKWTVKNACLVEVYRRALGELEQRGELTPRRARAAAAILWKAAHYVAHTHLDDACAIAEWIKRLDPDFVPPEGGILGRFYRTLGFRNTQRVLRARRAVVQGPAVILRERPVPRVIPSERPVSRVIPREQSDRGIYAANTVAGHGERTLDPSVAALPQDDIVEALPQDDTAGERSL